MSDRKIDDTEAKGREYTLAEVAFRLSKHRVTLLRMEERGFLPAPRWRRKGKSGNPTRVYNDKEIDEIKRRIAEFEANRDKGRNYVEDETPAT